MKFSVLLHNITVKSVKPSLPSSTVLTKKVRKSITLDSRDSLDSFSGSSPRAGAHVRASTPPYKTILLSLTVLPTNKTRRISE